MQIWYPLQNEEIEYYDKFQGVEQPIKAFELPPALGFGIWDSSVTSHLQKKEWLALGRVVDVVISCEGIRLHTWELVATCFKIWREIG